MMDDPIDDGDRVTLVSRDMWLLKHVLQALLVVNFITASLWAFWVIATENPSLIP